MKIKLSGIFQKLLGKQLPGKIVSKYNDINKYEYNATTNPGPLSIGDDPPINNFYNGMYNDASDESGIFARMGDETYPYGSWYTRVAKNSEVEARVDLAIKKWWVKPNAEIRITEYGADKLIFGYNVFILNFQKVYLNIKDQWVIKVDHFLED